MFCAAAQFYHFIDVDWNGTDVLLCLFFYVLHDSMEALPEEKGGKTIKLLIREKSVKCVRQEKCLIVM